MERIINAEQAEQAFYKVCKDFFADKVKGKVYMSETRPLNSNMEDVVVAVSALDAEQAQTGYVKVNVYVRDLMQPVQHVNHARITAIMAYADDLLTALRKGLSGYAVSYQLAPQKIPVQSTKEHVVNFSIKFNCITF